MDLAICGKGFDAVFTCDRAACQCLFESTARGVQLTFQKQRQPGHEIRRQQDGLIINISSWAGRYNSRVAGVAYGASKHAVLALNASINMEEGQHGIRACAISPAEVATPIMQQRPVQPTEEQLARMLQPDDLAETVLYVAGMPARACVNEILISPTWNRAYFADSERLP